MTIRTVWECLLTQLTHVHTSKDTLLLRDRCVKKGYCGCQCDKIGTSFDYNIIFYTSTDRHFYTKH